MMRMKILVVLVVAVCTVILFMCENSDAGRSSQEEDAYEGVETKDVSTFDIRGIKLGMTIQEIRKLFPKAEIKVENIPDPAKSALGYIDKKVTILERAGINSPNIEIKVDMANKQWGQGAIKIEYRAIYSDARISELEDIKEGLIKKYGKPANSIDNRKRWQANYSSGGKNCGVSMKILLRPNNLHLELVNRCPEESYRKGTRLNPGNVKF